MLGNKLSLKSSLAAAAIMLAGAGASAAATAGAISANLGKAAGMFRPTGKAPKFKSKSLTYRSRGRTYPWGSTRQEERQRRQHARNVVKREARAARTEAEWRAFEAEMGDILKVMKSRGLSVMPGIFGDTTAVFGTVTGRMVGPRAPEAHELPRGDSTPTTGRFVVGGSLVEVDLSKVEPDVLAALPGIGTQAPDSLGVSPPTDPVVIEIGGMPTENPNDFGVIGTTLNPASMA